MDRTESEKVESNRILWPLTVISVVFDLVVIGLAALSAAFFTPYGYVAENVVCGSGMMCVRSRSDSAVNNTLFNEMNALPEGVSSNSTGDSNATSGDATPVIEAPPAWFPRHGDLRYRSLRW
ncbi:MAG: hypothetical protein ACYCSA_05975 [Thermoplasmataceae archaeon]